MKITKAFIKKIPKTDLHVHLDGSIRLPTLIELARKKKIKLPAYTQKGLKELVFKKKYKNLEEYLRGFAYTVAVLQDAASLQRVAYELAMDNADEGVRYIEVRFAPQLHQSRTRNIVDVLRAVNRGLQKAKDEINRREPIASGVEPPFHYGIIVCAMRMFSKSFSEYFRNLMDVHEHSEKRWIYSMAAQELVRAAVKARDEHHIPVVGFDLAGMEKGYPASYFKSSFALAHRNFLNKTVHAGEDYGPESIFQAITDLHADRIGHGVHLFSTDMIENPEITNKRQYVKNLARYIGGRRITLEICLTSNMQTNPSMRRLYEHSFGKMRKGRLSVTFCTDNRTVSSTTVSREIKLAVDSFKLNPEELKDFVIYGFKRSFFHGSYLEKRKYVRQIIDYYEAIEKKMGIRS
jgi:adenosine deaminase